MEDHPTPGPSTAGSGPEPPTTTYNVSVNLNKLDRHWNALVDRGANGCIAGRDTRIIRKTTQTVDLSGIDNHTVRNLDIVQAGGVTRTQHGDAIVVINQAAYMPDGKTILSSPQIEHFKCTVNDRAKCISGQDPAVVTLEDYRIPISFIRGLPYIKLRPFTDKEYETYQDPDHVGT
jgi:hypothetical protein